MRFLACLPLVLAACATTPVQPQPPASTEPSPSTPVARFSGRVVTLAEVDARAADDLFKLQEQIYETRATAAERIALEAMVATEARKAGMSEDQWLAAHVETGLPQPSDNDLHDLFDKAKGRLPQGADYEELKPTLKQALLRDARAKKAREVFDELKAREKYELVFQEPPRQRKAVDATGPARGPLDAKVTIVVFADFQCPYCSRASQTVEKVLAAYPGKVRLVYRNYPLSFHALAPKAAEAAMCADEQGHFWEFHDALYANQEALEPGDLKTQAARMGLNEKKFEDCLDSGRMHRLVQRDLDAGEKLGVSGTPAYFINGLMLSGAQPVEAFRKIIDKELARVELGH